MVSLERILNKGFDSNLTFSQFEERVYNNFKSIEPTQHAIYRMKERHIDYEYILDLLNTKIPTYIINERNANGIERYVLIYKYDDCGDKFKSYMNVVLDYCQYNQKLSIVTVYKMKGK